MARSVLALVACMALLSSPWSAAQVRTNAGQPQGSEETHAPTRFDIDAQALATALRAFSENTGIAVLFDDGLVADKRSQGLHGMAAPRDALRILLVGTGLGAHFSSMNAFTVTASSQAPEDEGVTPGHDAGPAGDMLDERSARAVQVAVERALCAHEDTRPGGFRLAMQLWIGDGGGVTDVAALAASDDPRRDDRVLATLRSLRLPADVHRSSPVTVLLTPSVDADGACRAHRATEG
ncbi:STN domain-containing protein [Luteibacter sp. E-22]|uniref:STN domain-containing protein n=1 Tax=Luteibacter sp. E-22 TaxID=3404050 RepID=UPI003CF66CBA